MADGSFIAKPPSPITPPLKWAGGKRWLGERLAKSLTVSFDRLIEPFAGSAATFFRLRPKAAILADTNAELINVYRCLKADHERLYALLQGHAALHSHDYYYATRAEDPVGEFAKAARLLYLNRTCWNALYRVNREGRFNVPKGTKDTVLLPTDDFPAAAAALKTAELVRADFAQTIAHAGKGDLIFADPPYFSRSVVGTFVKYTDAVFTWPDQERLADALLSASGRGARFILTNVDAPELENLYAGHGHLLKLQRASIISGQAIGRKPTTEIVWTSFPLHL